MTLMRLIYTDCSLCDHLVFSVSSVFLSFLAQYAQYPVTKPTLQQLEYSREISITQLRKRRVDFLELNLRYETVHVYILARARRCEQMRFDGTDLKLTHFCNCLDCFPQTKEPEALYRRHIQRFASGNRRPFHV